MIRAAVPNDIERLVELGRQLHAESWFAHMPFDPAVLAATIARVLEVGFAYVHERDGTIDGGMLGMLAPSWFGAGSIAGDLTLFVQQNRRGGIACYRLVEAFIAWAGARGALEVSLGISTGVKPAMLGKLYERIGFTYVGGQYKMKMRGG